MRCVECVNKYLVYEAAIQITSARDTTNRITNPQNNNYICGLSAYLIGSSFLKMMNVQNKNYKSDAAIEITRRQIMWFAMGRSLKRYQTSKNLAPQQRVCCDHSSRNLKKDKLNDYLGWESLRNKTRNHSYAIPSNDSQRQANKMLAQDCWLNVLRIYITNLSSCSCVGLINTEYGDRKIAVSIALGCGTFDI